jgi:hypothetical protein
MTVAVQQNTFGSGPQWKIEPGREFFEKHACGSHRSGLRLLLAAEQRGNVVFNRREAARLQEEYFPAPVGDGPQAVDDLNSLRARAFQQPLRDERAAAASGADHFDRASATLENFNRGDSDFRVVVIGEGVVEKSYELG